MMEFICEYYIQFILGISTTGIIFLYTRFKHLISKQISIETGVQALLRNEIIRVYNRYMDMGYIPIYALENVMAMYLEYKNLGGNGTITELMDKLKRLPSSKLITGDKVTTVTTTIA